MRNIRSTELPNTTESAEYLRGYRDGLKDRMSLSRRRSGVGVAGTILAIVLLAGLGYLLYNYSTTGRPLPNNIESTPPRLTTPNS